ncbi:MAG: RNA polymerase sporulation sigma factor SigK [Clostridia bacterium]|nr:RNA polymerase sporulation sigma factor SigK [Clostridia bacterium]
MLLLLSAISRIFFVLSYISSKDAFPKPMTAKEEQTALRKMAEGDMKAREQLIEKNLRLVVHIAKKYQTVGFDADDLVSVGTIGLIKAVNTFSPDKGIRLATYAARCVENEILMVLRSSKKNKNDVSMEEPIGMDKEGNEINLMDVICASDNVEEAVEMNLKVARLYEAVEEALSNREKQVIIHRYGLYNAVPKPQREVAKTLNISRSYVSRIEKKAILKLAEFLKEE